MAHELPDLFSDPHVRVLTGAVSESEIARLSTREAAAVAGVAPKRLREFATARGLARNGLERFFDIHDFDLLNGEDRAPVWPEGISGSISHSSTRAWVALVESVRGSVGIDGENREGLERKLWRLTLREEEVAYLDTLETSMRERRALVIFSAKEAVFKAQYPWSRRFVGFNSVQIRLDETGTFDCVFRAETPPFRNGFVAAGRWFDRNEIVTTVLIPAP